MNEDQSNNPISEEVLTAIKEKRVSMRPKWHFILKASLSALGGAISFFALLYLASFIAFVLRRSGVWFAPVFGTRGWYAFLVSLPWVLILLSLVFLIILEILVKRYAFTYRRPLVYSVSGVLIVVIVGGIVVAQTSFHRRFSRYIEVHHLPLAGGFYRQFGDPRPRDIHRGSVREMTSQGFVVEGPPGVFFNVIVTPHTRFPFGVDFQRDDEVVIFGDEQVDTIQAFGVRRIEPDPE